jgi:hypothetical protein
MTITSTTNYVSYSGNDVTVAFSFPHKFLKNADIKAILINSTSKEETAQTNPTHFSVSGEGVQGGGTVTFVTAPPTGYTVFIYCEPALTSDTDLEEGGTFPSETIEEAFDRVYTALQALDRRVDRCLKLPDQATDVDPTIPYPVSAGAIPIVNSDEDGFLLGEQVDAGDLSVSSFMENMLNDPNALTARATIDAQQATNSLTAETAPAMNDLVPIYDASVAANRKMTLANVLKLVIATKITTYVVTATDDLILADATSGAFTITLPTAVGITGRTYKFKKTDSTFSQVTIDGDGTETIDGAANTTLATQNESVELVSDGANWQIVRRFIPSVATAFTPTGAWSTNTTYTGFWKRFGDSIEIDVKVALAGAPTSATLTVNLPSGLTIDTAKMVGTLSGTNALGICDILDSASAVYHGTPVYNNTTSVLLRSSVSSTASTTYADVTQTVPITFGASDHVIFKCRVPITGWKG